MQGLYPDQAGCVSVGYFVYNNEIAAQRGSASRHQRTDVGSESGECECFPLQRRMCGGDRLTIAKENNRTV